MRKAKYSKATPETLKMLDKLIRECEFCQRMSEQPGRFRVSIPNDEILFNRLIQMDLMVKFESNNLLYINCSNALFGAAVFLVDVQSNAAVWQAYNKHWVHPYIRYSKFIHND